MAVPSPENLGRLGSLLADRTPHVPLQRTYDLAQAPDALAALTSTMSRASWPSTFPNELTGAMAYDRIRVKAIADSFTPKRVRPSEWRRKGTSVFAELEQAVGRQGRSRADPTRR